MEYMKYKPAALLPSEEGVVDKEEGLTITSSDQNVAEHSTVSLLPNDSQGGNTNPTSFSVPPGGEGSSGGMDVDDPAAQGFLEALRRRLNRSRTLPPIVDPPQRKVSASKLSFASVSELQELLETDPKPDGEGEAEDSKSKSSQGLFGSGEVSSDQDPSQGGGTGGGIKLPSTLGPLRHQPASYSSLASSASGSQGLWGNTGGRRRKLSDTRTNCSILSEDCPFGSSDANEEQLGSEVGGRGHRAAVFYINDQDTEEDGSLDYSGMPGVTNSGTLEEYQNKGLRLSHSQTHLQNTEPVHGSYGGESHGTYVRGRDKVPHRTLHRTQSLPQASSFRKDFDAIYNDFDSDLEKACKSGISFKYPLMQGPSLEDRQYGNVHSSYAKEAVARRGPGILEGRRNSRGSSGGMSARLRHRMQQSGRQPSTSQQSDDPLPVFSQSAVTSIDISYPEGYYEASQTPADIIGNPIDKDCVFNKNHIHVNTNFDDEDDNDDECDDDDDDEDGGGDYDDEDHGEDLDNDSSQSASSPDEAEIIQEPAGRDMRILQWLRECDSANSHRDNCLPNVPSG